MLEAHGISTGPRRDAHPRRRQSRTHPFRGRFRQLCGVCPFQPRAANEPPSPQSGRQPTGQCCPVSVVIVRMRNHQPTSIRQKRKQMAKAKWKSSLFKRFVAREIFGYLCGAQRSVPSISKPLDRYRASTPRWKAALHDQNRTRAPRCYPTGKLPGMTCSLTSKDITIVSATFRPRVYHSEQAERQAA